MTKRELKKELYAYLEENLDVLFGEDVQKDELWKESILSDDLPKALEDFAMVYDVELQASDVESEIISDVVDEWAELIVDCYE